jgi:DEAD/DEAH box helicase domain-containing protein
MRSPDDERGRPLDMPFDDTHGDGPHDDAPLVRPSAPWASAKGLASVLEGWRADAGIARCLALDESLRPREGRFAPLPPELPASVAAALRSRGIERLYAHQAESLAHARSGRDLVIATPTASGKSLCFNLPVLERLAAEPGARALYLFPTKALARDQEQALRALLRDAGLDHGAITYDGDTPGDARRAARERSGVILTNPDMLHAGILPHHAAWSRLFANLRYVVVDELHTYRGVFGSHLANVVRRLIRVARFHGSSPVFLLASATIGNPREHASRIVGRPVELVAESGAPEGPRRVLVYNPPVLNPELGLRASYVKSAVRLAADLVRAEVPTIVFGQSRNNVEVMLKYLREVLARDKVDPSIIHAYRGGYLPEQRRRIEEQLRSGAIRCVVATNALELGIDIGMLDAVVCAGYPGTHASLWQRFGRAGRRKDGSLALLVTSSAPLDQYVAKDAHALVRAPVEEARIDPDNVEILLQHLKCAAFELPFEAGETFGGVTAESVGEAMDFLEKHQVVHAVTAASGRTTWHWAADAYPANHVSLRSLGWDNFVIIDLATDKNIAEMDWRSTHTMLHEQAIYQHDAEQYQVERLDFENHKAFVRKVKPDYYTDAMTYTSVTVLEEADAAFVQLAGEGGAGLAAGLGDVNVVEKVVGYKKIKFHTHENVGYGDVRLPEMQMHTTSFWLTFPEELVRGQEQPRALVVDAIRGVGNALHTVAAAGLMIDPRDLGQTLGSRDDEGGAPGRTDAGAVFDPTVFLYDHAAGGIGLAPRLFEARESLLRRARRLIDACTCTDGCPACIGPEAGDAPLRAGGASQPARASAETDSPSRKALALAVLAAAGVLPEQ